MMLTRFGISMVYSNFFTPRTLVAPVSWFVAVAVTLTSPTTVEAKMNEKNKQLVQNVIMVNKFNKDCF